MLVVVIGYAATRWALDHLLCGEELEDLVDAPFDAELWTAAAEPALGGIAGCARAQL
jgi:hypothetical protein